MTFSSLATNKLLPKPTSPAMTGFTSSTTYVVPAGCTTATLCVVGSGAGGTSGSTNNNDVLNSCGGAGGTVTQQTVGVIAGETLTITIGAGGGSTALGNTSSISGSFGTVSAAGGANNSNAGGGGTYVTGFGWFAGNGAGYQYGGNQPASTTHGPHGGKTFGANGVGSQAAPANTGGGGGGNPVGNGGTGGGSGFVGIFVR